jgi:hypothetical protein
LGKKPSLRGVSKLYRGKPIEANQDDHDTNEAKENTYDLWVSCDYRDLHCDSLWSPAILENLESKIR